MVVISPTRESANQIATEAKQLTTFHEGISVAHFVGGTNIKGDYKVKARGVSALLEQEQNFQKLVQILPFKNDPDFALRVDWDEAIKKGAEEKFKQVQKAYETIQAERGL